MWRAIVQGQMLEIPQTSVYWWMVNKTWDIHCTEHYTKIKSKETLKWNIYEPQEHYATLK